jgi:roadblock/LC7 domain-containing protein
VSWLDTIDIRELTEKYDELVAAIDGIVAIGQLQGDDRPLPDKIIMTKKQQKMLRRYKQMSTMFGTTQKLWLSEHCAMEVNIKE